MNNELKQLDEIREKYLSGQNIFRRNSVEFLLEQIAQLVEERDAYQKDALFLASVWESVMQIGYEDIRDYGDLDGINFVVSELKMRAARKNAIAGLAVPELPMLEIKTLKHNEVPDIPGHLFECPICGDLLTLEIDEWEQMDDGTWRAGECGVHISCASEPDFESDDYDDWLNGHFSMPYVDWMPLTGKVFQWLEKNYRFESFEQAET